MKVKNVDFCLSAVNGTQLTFSINLSNKNNKLKLSTIIINSNSSDCAVSLCQGSFFFFLSLLIAHTLVISCDCRACDGSGRMWTVHSFRQPDL